jgi:hypothetical protein
VSTTLARRTRFRRVDDGSDVGTARYEGAFDASWNQGPGAFGGLLAATLGQCLEDFLPGRSLRALSLHLAAPAVPGPLVVLCRLERRGTRMAFASARILSGADDRVVVLATATLASDRVSDAVRQTDFDRVKAPELPPVGSMADPGTGPGVPAFTEHFEFRFAVGLPFAGQTLAYSAGWLRPRHRAEGLSTALALACLDCWPLAVLTTFDRPRPASSVAIHFQLFPPLPHTAPIGPGGAWLRADVRSDLAREGVSDQVNGLWTADGQLIGRSHQLVAVLR